MITQDEAKQLRPTNFITSKEWGGIHAIQGIEITDNGFEIKVKDYVHKFEQGKYFDLAFIPLSEEILLRCGFEGNIFNGFSNGKLELSYITTDNHFQMELKFPNGDWFVLDAKYLHHLQNIASDFGQELKLKP